MEEERGGVGGGQQEAALFPCYCVLWAGVGRLVSFKAKSSNDLGMGVMRDTSSRAQSALSEHQRDRRNAVSRSYMPPPPARRDWVACVQRQYDGTSAGQKEEDLGGCGKLAVGRVEV